MSRMPRYRSVTRAAYAPRVPRVAYPSTGFRPAVSQ